MPSPSMPASSPPLAEASEVLPYTGKRRARMRLSSPVDVYVRCTLVRLEDVHVNAGTFDAEVRVEARWRDEMLEHVTEPLPFAHIDDFGFETLECTVFRQRVKIDGPRLVFANLVQLFESRCRCVNLVAEKARRPDGVRCNLCITGVFFGRFRGAFDVSNFPFDSQAAHIVLRSMRVHPDTWRVHGPPTLYAHPMHVQLLPETAPEWRNDVSPSVATTQLEQEYVLPADLDVQPAVTLREMSPSLLEHSELHVLIRLRRRSRPWVTNVLGVLAAIVLCSFSALLLPARDAGALSVKLVIVGAAQVALAAFRVRHRPARMSERAVPLVAARGLAVAVTRAPPAPPSPCRLPSGRACRPWRRRRGWIRTSTCACSRWSSCSRPSARHSCSAAGRTRAQGMRARRERSPRRGSCSRRAAGAW